MEFSEYILRLPKNVLRVHYAHCKISFPKWKRRKIASTKFWFSSKVVNLYLFIFTLALHSSTVLLHCGNVYFPIHTHTHTQTDQVNKQTNKQRSFREISQITFHIRNSPCTHSFSLLTWEQLFYMWKMCTQKYSNVCQENRSETNERKKV